LIDFVPRYRRRNREHIYGRRHYGPFATPAPRN
jgi:hypothetical protein